MAVAKLKALNSAHVMKPEEGKEPSLSFPRTNDGPMQWFQLLHALEKQDVPGWPLLAPLKVQMQKCDKCSLEFCSSINYRRHMRVYHRLKRLDKDSSKYRDLLGAFWDKLSADKMQEILSFKDVKLEDAMKEILLLKDVKLKEGTESSIVNSLTNLLRKPGFASLSQPYWIAGTDLLDIIQAMPSKFPLSSKELFGVLENASENTFLCGKDVSTHKYIFDGEVGKTGEMKNLVALTSFLVEWKLVKAWLADKDAEALRCQKLLVEEEEAAQKRQSELLERRRQKKLRQKEQRTKEQKEENKADINKWFDDPMEAVSLADQSCFDSDIQARDTPPDHSASCLESFQLPNTDEDVVLKIQTAISSKHTNQANYHNVDRQTTQGGSHRLNVVSRWQMSPKSQRNHLPNGFHSSHNSQVPKLRIMQKHGKPLPIFNGNRKWSRKSKADSGGESFKDGVYKEAIDQPDHDKKHEVLIGSISVTLGTCSHHKDNNMDGPLDDCHIEQQMPRKNNLQGKHNRPDSGQSTANRAIIKLWRPVSQHGTKGTTLVENGTRKSRDDGMAEDQTLFADNCLRSSVEDGNFGGTVNGSLSLEANLCPGSSQFSTKAARTFLAERWKEAIGAEHVKLVIDQNFEQPGCGRISQVAESLASDVQTRAIVSNTENKLVNGMVNESTVGSCKTKFKTKFEKGVKLKYMPKQRTFT